MSKLEMKVPSPGESISEVIIANWLVKNGDYVQKDQVIAEIDSDKATLELAAESAGTIEIKVQAGDTIAVGGVACIIDTSAAAPAGVSAPSPAAPAAAAATPAPSVTPNPMPVSNNHPASGHPSPSAAKMMW